MKIRRKKILLSGIAVTVAGVLGVGALLQTSISVQASPAMMPGIEEIVNETSKDEPFRILEIVDSEAEAEIGYYVSGQEPYIKLYKDENGNAMSFSSLEDGLSKLSEKQRKEFATNKKTDENGNVSSAGKNIESLCGDSAEEYPLAYSEYQEQYFVSSEDGWKRVDFVDADGNPRTDTVKIRGHYQENTAGNGQYTKEEQTYYPIRKNVTEDNAKTNKYRENIENFYYSDDEEAQAPYALTFAEVKNEDVNNALKDANDRGQTTILPEYDYSNGKYGYYENVYADFTEDIANNIQNNIFKFPGENPVVDESRAVLIQDNTPQGASAFTAGEEAEFSTVNDGSETTAASQSEFAGETSDNSGADAFSTGDFGDGTSDGDAQIPSSQDTSQTAGMADELTDNAQAEEQTSKGRTILLGFANEETKGTTENPYIYLGENIQAYPYYKYTLVGDLEKIKALAQDNQKKDAESVTNKTQIVRNEKDITLEDGQYWYWKMDTASGQLARYPLSIVTGRQAVPYSDIKKIDSSLDYNYYYTVEKAYFCCEASADAKLPTDYQYYGWYYASYPQNDGNTYIKVTDGDGKVATHYISDAEYKLTPGTGDYDFIPNEQEPEQTVEVNHIFYQGGYVNHDWFKRYVFHLSPDDEEQFANFDIKVDTITAQEFNEKYGIQTAAVSTENAEGAADIADSAAGDDGASSDSETDQLSDETQMEEPQQEEAQTEESQTEELQEDGGETSEVDSMVSEAGVELVSIENEINDNVADEFQDGTDAASDTDNTDAQQAESETVTSGTPDADFSDGESDGTSAFSAGTAQTATIADSELSQYDLIYVNGIVTTEAVQAMGTIPVMINSVKAYRENDLLEAFSAYTEPDDADRHYVDRMVYFFKNTFSDDNPSGLINRDFHTNFNSESEGSTFTDGSRSEGFEEILKYIESENQYRQIGQTTDESQSLSDGEENSDSESSFSANNSKVQLLSKELTQARAIEYIINYQYKRNLNTKSSIKVLEIEPAKTGSTLDQNTVLGWLGKKTNDPIEIDTVTADCEQNSGNEKHPASNILDSDQNLFWHSAWNSSGTNYHASGNHTLTITLKKASDISGFIYTPRRYSTNGDQNGKILNFAISLYDKNGKELLKDETNDKELYTDRTDNTSKTYTFKDGKTYKNVKKITIRITEAYHDNTTSDTIASCAHLEFFNSENIQTQVTVTSMTASEYVGHVDDINSEYDMIYIGDSLNESSRDIRINGTKPMLYTHVGGAINLNDIHTGSGSNDIRKLSLMGMLDIDYVIGTDGKKKIRNTNLYNTGENGETQYAGLGSLRGSGNDITRQQYNELLDFVKSGYPVVLGNSLVDSKSGKISTQTVDNSSWYYRFLNESLSYENVSTVSGLSDSQFTFFANLAKPVIEFTDTGRPLEVPRTGGGQNSSNTGYLSADKENIEYTFTVKNDSDAAPASTTYNCQLYFDLNFDGNLSDAEEQSKYIEICDDAGNVLSRKDGVYQLRIGKTYTVARKIPYDYFKAINWKLQLVSNSNSSVRTSVTGYSKRNKQNGKQKVNVLQIIPSVPSGGDATLATWNLEDDWTKNHSSWFYKEMSAVEDFTLNIQTKTVAEYVDNQKQLKNGTIDKNQSLLDGKDMLILGFGDVYENIDNTDGAVDNIKRFIQNGKSVIFTHDTTSNINWNYKEFNNEPITEDGKQIKDSWLWKNSINRQDWGYSLNSLFRSIAGLDRYGITNDEAYSIKGGNTNISSLLKAGNMLSANASDVDFDYMEQMVGDVAYVTNSNRSQSYMQTQGYINKEITKMKAGDEVNSITKVNDGIITEYPYKLKDGVSQTYTVANTHGQYYQLALEKDLDINGVSDGKNDIVVWYCLSGDYYQNSPNDVRNNYYFYSRGNVIYTGVGHRKVTGKDEVDLFVNAIVAAANITAVSPYVDFVKTLNPAAQVEKTRYYATDQTSWTQTDANTLEKDMDFYINIKDYNMISSSLSQEDQDKEDMTVEFYIGGNSIEDSVSINSVIGKMIPYNKNADVVTLDTSDGLFHLKDRDNDAYKISISDIEQYLQESGGNYKNNCNLYVKVTSKAALYGELKENSSVTSVSLKQRQLFELD